MNENLVIPCVDIVEANVLKLNWNDELKILASSSPAAVAWEVHVVPEPSSPRDIRNCMLRKRFLIPRKQVELILTEKEVNSMLNRFGEGWRCVKVFSKSPQRVWSI